MGVILDGVFENNIFVADDMLVKHDNEYVSSDGETYDVKSYSK
jgi:cytochrome c-type biogenesis protein CcmE